ncbi:type VI secretion system tip protein TssI/VgrG [Paraburkholderia unamae]|uniref:Type VI secretion system secreted protein VgrG n=1 Tax=Paraburkholderia unamae TaxID=219649 RepID=A0ABX5KR81_9BURK|nr:type VI secretion system tip protein TssI/VgrG [Paraburkholderia unamae]PVX85175.1 type VI secretion system secreted protein VgrG [Paraburkholderia unamae]
MARTITQAGSFLSVSTPFGEDVLLLDGFSGREAISELFRFELRMRSLNKALDAARIVGQIVTVTLQSPGGPVRCFSGMVVRFAHAGTDSQHGFYSAELAPRVWLLTLGRDRVIHQHKSVPEIVKTVLDAAGVQYESRLSGTAYAQREYCVQYDESPFAFISRLMEEEGIFYFFTFANGAHTLVLADSAAAHHTDATSARLYFSTTASASGEPNRVSEFEMTHRLVAHDHVLGDYDFANASPSKTGPVTPATAPEGRRYTFPGKYADAAEGERKAAVRRAACEVAQQAGSGACDCYSLAAGTRFTLADHPGGDALNTGYVVRAVTHDASHHGYVNRFEAFLQATPFRAPCVTPLPVVAGTHTAKVVGLAGEEIWTDAYGRVKLKFHWDTTPDADQDSSCWVRVQQASAGNGWGVLFLPRVGQEVVVSYVDGDPDRPLVTGAVYNGQNVTPVALPDSHTQSVLRSRSSKNGAAGNEIRMEDRMGAEELYLHAQRDMNVAIEQALTTTVIAGAETHVVKAGDRSVDVQTGNERHTVKGQRTLEIGAEETHTNHASYTQETGGDHTLRVSGNLVIDVSGSITIQSGGAFTLKSGAAFAAEAATSFGQKAGTSLTVEGLTIEHKASATQTVDGGGLLALKGGLVKLN